MSLSSLIVAFCNQPRLNEMKGISIRLTKFSTQKYVWPTLLLVLWKGYPMSKATWEPINHVKIAQDTIKRLLRHYAH